MKPLALTKVFFYVALLALTSRVGATTYVITPHDVGSAGGLEILGGTYTTDGTTGTGLKLGDILTSWKVDITDGTTPLSLTPSNSSITSNTSSSFDVTASEITFTAFGPVNSFAISTPTCDATACSRMTWTEGDGMFFLEELRLTHPVSSQSEVASPFPFGVGNVATPEPGTLSLLSLGVMGLAGFGWRVRKRHAKTSQSRPDHQ